jgi:hypothetical protein
MTTPLFQHPGYAGFAKGFFERHTDELDFLFDQRQVFFADPLVPWPSVERLDARIRAHAAALAAWGEPALTFLRTRLEAPDTALPAAFTLAHAGAEDDAKVAVAALATGPAALLPRYVLGLSMARGPDLSGSLEPLGTSESAPVRAAVATILGHRRRGRTPLLEHLLHDADLTVQLAAARALARLGARDMAPALERKAAEAPPEQDGFLWPLVELGSRSVHGLCRQAFSAGKTPSPDAALALAITGDPSDVALLRALSPAPRAAHALGLLGAVTAVPWLLQMLAPGDEPLQVAAGAALARFTGAPLVETADLPAPDTEDPPRAPALRVQRPSTSRVAWERWWHAHRARFDERTRYRAGAPLEARAATEELAAPFTPFAERRRAAAEVRWLTRAPFLFDPDGWIIEQRQALKE